MIQPIRDRRLTMRTHYPIICAIALFSLCLADVAQSQQDKNEIRIKDLSGQAKTNAKYFADLEESKQEKVRQLHKKLESRPDKQELTSELQKFHQWFEKLTPSQQQDLKRTFQSGRMDKIRSLKAKQNNNTQDGSQGDSTDEPGKPQDNDSRDTDPSKQSPQQPQTGDQTDSNPDDNEQLQDSQPESQPSQNDESNDESNGSSNSQSPASSSQSQNPGESPSNSGSGSQSATPEQPSEPQTGNEAGTQSGGGQLPNTSGTQEMDAPNPDQENLEYSKALTDLVLEQLENQKYDPDPKLLEQMNWTQQDLDNFLKSWQAMKKAAQTGNVESKKDYEERLLSLGLSPKTRTRTVQAKKDIAFQLNEDGAVDQIPAEYREKFNNFLKRRNRSKRK